MEKDHPFDILAEQLDKKTEAKKAEEGKSPERNLNNKQYIQKPIRTYESDVAQALGHKNISRASMVIAEKNRQTGELLDKKDEIKVEPIIATNQYAILKDETLEKVPHGEQTENIEIKKEIPMTIKPINNIVDATSDLEAEPVKIQKNNNVRNLPYIILGLLFIGLGIYIGFYFYKNSPVSKVDIATEDLPKKIPSIINHDGQTKIYIDNLNTKDIYTKIQDSMKSSKVKDKNVLDILFMIKKDGMDVQINSEQFIEKLSISMPNQLSRSLNKRFMFGITNENIEGNVPFIAFSTDFFQNSYAGMLAWEKDMADELEDLMDYRSYIDSINSRPENSINNYFGIRGKFIDKQIKNRDVREYVHETGKILFLYSFIDKNTLVITKTEEALINIIGNIEKQNYIR